MIPWTPHKNIFKKWVKYKKEGKFNTHVNNKMMRFLKFLLKERKLPTSWNQANNILYVMSLVLLRITWNLRLWSLNIVSKEKKNLMFYQRGSRIWWRIMIFWYHCSWWIRREKATNNTVYWLETGIQGLGIFSVPRKYHNFTFTNCDQSGLSYPKLTFVYKSN